MKREIILASYAVTLFAILGIGVTYANEFKMPFDPEYLIDHWLDVKLVPTDDGGVDVTVTHTSLFHFTNLFQVPDQITVQVVDDTDTILDTTSMTIVSSVEEILKPEPEPTEAEKLGISEESLARLDEKRTDTEKIAEEALRCVLGIEGASIFTEYRELLVLEKMIYFKNLPSNTQEVQIIKWTEECRVWSESYLARYQQYTDIYLDEQKYPDYSKVSDDTDSPATDPLTEEDFAETIEDAERFMCSVEGKQRGLCIKEFTGINQGGFSYDSAGNIVGAECGIRPSETGIPTLDCPLNDYNALISSAISAEENYTEIEKIVCDKYLSQYQNLVERIIAGDETAELPHWLQHCEVS